MACLHGLWSAHYETLQYGAVIPLRGANECKNNAPEIWKVELEAEVTWRMSEIHC